jgi:GNAT superfamily N-acetyltransferase
MAPKSSETSVENSASFSIRPAAKRDIADITLLNAQLGYPESIGTIGARFSRIRKDRRNHRVFVALADAGQTISPWDRPLIGWVHVFIDKLLTVGPRAEVGGIVVDAAWRSWGVGWALLRKSEQWAQARGVSQVVIHTNVVRKEAHRFYEKCGYNVLKQSKVYTKEIK